MSTRFLTLFNDGGEPIYVGQTNEQLRVRIRRHLTNQRTDAVAMKVLVPFEVFEIEIWPLPDFEGQDMNASIARRLNWLERAMFGSTHRAIAIQGDS